MCATADSKHPTALHACVCGRVRATALVLNRLLKSVTPQASFWRTYMCSCVLSFRCVAALYKHRASIGVTMCPWCMILCGRVDQPTACMEQRCYTSNNTWPWAATITPCSHNGCMQEAWVSNCAAGFAPPGPRESSICKTDSEPAARGRLAAIAVQSLSVCMCCSPCCCFAVCIHGVGRTRLFWSNPSGSAVLSTPARNPQLLQHSA